VPSPAYASVAPVAGIVRVPLAVVVHPSAPATTVPEFIAYAKAHPGKVNMASGGTGEPSHVAGELFMMMTGVSLVHVRIADWHSRSPICSAGRCR
jgi:tripartite-type tricarboxylate transporter receptor subunit TctC